MSLYINKFPNPLPTGQPALGNFEMLDLGFASWVLQPECLEEDSIDRF